MSCTYSIPNMHANEAVHHTLDPTTHAHRHPHQCTRFDRQQPIRAIRLFPRGTCGKKNGHDRTVQTRVSVWSSGPRVASTRVSCRVHRATADAPSPRGGRRGAREDAHPHAGEVWLVCSRGIDSKQGKSLLPTYPCFSTTREAHEVSRSCKVVKRATTCLCNTIYSAALRSKSCWFQFRRV